MKKMNEMLTDRSAPASGSSTEASAPAPGTASVSVRRGGRAAITDGPYSRPGSMGGLLVIDVPDLDAAPEVGKPGRRRADASGKFGGPTGGGSAVHPRGGTRWFPRVLRESRACSPRARTRGLHPRPAIRRHRPRGGVRPGPRHNRARALARGGDTPEPCGWILTTARNRAINRLRRDAARPAPPSTLRPPPSTRQPWKTRRKTPCRTNGYA